MNTLNIGSKVIISQRGEDDVNDIIVSDTSTRWKTKYNGSFMKSTCVDVGGAGMWTQKRMYIDSNAVKLSEVTKREGEFIKAFARLDNGNPVFIRQDQEYLDIKRKCVLSLKAALLLKDNIIKQYACHEITEEMFIAMQCHIDNIIKSTTLDGNDYFNTHLQSHVGNIDFILGGIDKESQLLELYKQKNRLIDCGELDEAGLVEIDKKITKVNKWVANADGLAEFVVDISKIS